MYNREYIEKIARLTKVELDKRILEKKVRAIIKANNNPDKKENSSDKKVTKILLDKFKKFIKMPSKEEAKKIVQKSTNKDIEEAYKIIPKILKNDEFGKKESFSFKDIKKKVLLLAAIAVLGGVLTGCGKADSSQSSVPQLDPPSKEEVVNYYDMELRTSDFEPTRVKFTYWHKFDDDWFVLYFLSLSNNGLGYYKDPVIYNPSRTKMDSDDPELKDHEREAREYIEDLENDIISARDIFKREYIGDINTFVESSKPNEFTLEEIKFYYTSPESGKEYYLTWSTSNSSSIKKPSDMPNDEYYQVNKYFDSMRYKRFNP